MSDSTLLLGAASMILLVVLVVVFAPRLGGKPSDSVDTGGNSAADID